MEILLHAKEMLAVRGDHRGIRLSCADGRLWITQQGDPRDHLLGPGQQFATRLRGMIVVTALAGSRLGLPGAAPRVAGNAGLHLAPGHG